jgi:DNA-binding beta-propeller fold protein YncE
VLDVLFGPDAADHLLAAQHPTGVCVMNAKRWFCLVLLTSLLAGCAQPAPMPTLTPLPLLPKDPYGIVVDSGGRIYVADRGSDCIIRLDDVSGTRWTAYGSRGSGEGQFKSPMDVFVDSAGKIYITDQRNHRIVRMDDMSGSNWTALGSQWTTTGGSGSGSGQFNSPTGIFVAPGGKIYVADNANHRIVRIDDMSGSNWTIYGSNGSGAGQFSFVSDICAGISVDSDSSPLPTASLWTPAAGSMSLTLATRASCGSMI